MENIVGKFWQNFMLKVCNILGLSFSVQDARTLQLRELDKKNNG